MAYQVVRALEQALDRPGVHHHPYLERAAGDGSGLLEALSSRASVVVTDDYPTFFVPRMVAAAAARRTFCMPAGRGPSRSLNPACTPSP